MEQKYDIERGEMTTITIDGEHGRLTLEASTDTALMQLLAEHLPASPQFSGLMVALSATPAPQLPEERKASSESKRYVDFKKLKERVSIQDILNHYGWAFLRTKDGGWKGDCPLCDGANTFGVSLEKGAFKCFACGRGGNSLDLVAAVEKTTLPSTAVLVAEWFGIADCGYEKPKPTRA